MAAPLHAQPVARPLRLLTLNANGLGSDPDKRRTLFGAFIRGPWDVLCVQEAHATSASEVDAWAQMGAGLGMPLVGSAYANPHTSRSAGVVTLLKATAPLTAPRQGVAPLGGRLLDVCLSYAGVEFSLLNCYAPCEARERPGFFSEDFATAVPADRPVLACGDWNFVPGAEDLTGPVGTAGLQRRQQGGHEFTAVQLDKELVDVWRQLHPDDSGVTFIAARGMASRLDRWYVSAALLPWVQSCEVVHGLPGDHLAVQLTILPPNSLPSGPGRWRLPLHLLDDKQFCKGVTAKITSFLAEHPVQDDSNHRERWDALKASIIHFCMAFDLQARRAASQCRRQLLKQVEMAEQAFLAHPSLPGMLQAYHATQQALQQHEMQEAAKRTAAAEVLWHSYGEQPTKWFHHLGRAPSIHHPFPAVKNPADVDATAANMTTAAGRAEAMKYATSFFSSDSPVGLFRSHPTDPAAQAELLAALDKFLTPEEAAATLGPLGNGLLSSKEIKKLFSSLPRGVSPGQDGLPYEFYIHFWGALHTPFLSMAAEVLGAALGIEQRPDNPVLPASMLVGLIVLVLKEGKTDLTDLASRRPITLLNCDYRLLARVLSARYASPLASIIDSTQTAFLPKRWIGDNVLFHLEEISYLEEAGQEATVVILDYEKAYDRCNRDWIFQVMEHMGFPELSVRWVRLLLAGTMARVSLNGYYSPTFPVRNSVQQGSPLSTLLYVISAQPMAAHLRQQQACGVISAITLPDGSPAPPSHQHADDTSLHVRTPADVRTILSPGGSVGLHCRASGAKVHPDKCKGMRFGPHPQLDPITRKCGVCGVFFPPVQEPIRHLGIFLGNDITAANARTFARLQHGVLQAALLWKRHKLSWLGRTYIAKQVLVAIITYHACFLPLAPTLLRSLRGIIYRFVRGASMVDGEGSGPILHPGLAVTSLPGKEGGVGMVDLEVQIQSLQGKVGARLLHPSPHPWKVLMAAALQRSLPALGTAVLVSSMQATHHSLSPRHLAYVRGFQLTQPHRIVQPDQLTPAQVRAERLCYNWQIRRLSTGEPLRPTPALQQAGVFSVGHLAAMVSSPQQPLPLALRRVWDRVPAAWQQLALQEGQPQWEVARAAHLVRDGEGKLYSVQHDGSLEELQDAPSPSQLVWEPCCVLSIPLPDNQEEEPASALFLLAPWTELQVDPSIWGHGGKGVLQYTVKEAAVRRVQLRALQELPGGWYIPKVGLYPPIWDPPLEAPASLQGHMGLSAMEQRWGEAYTAATHAAAGSPATALPVRAFVPARPRWMDPPGQPRPPPALRGSAAPPPAVLSREDVRDALDSTGQVSAELSAEVRAVWRRLKVADLPREQLSTVYRILHGALHVGGFMCYAGGLPPDQACCTNSACEGELETLTHGFISCPVIPPAAQWVCQVFAAVAGCDAPPATAVVLLGDRWQPPAGTQHAWTALRAAYLHSVWVLRCQRTLASSQFTAAAICGTVVSLVSASIHRDWARCTSDLVQLSGAPPEWFRGRSPALELGTFKRRWAVGGVLCSVAGGELGDEDQEDGDALPTQQGPASADNEDVNPAREKPSMTLHFSTSHPVPIPRPSSAASAPAAAASLL